MNMKTSLGDIREAVGSGFWFVPGMMMLGAAAAAYLLVWVDESIDSKDVGFFGYLIATDLDGARVLLSAIASSIISVAGVVFSITVVVLSVAAGQLGPRLLRSFMRLRTTQYSLGAFTATFLFCLLLLVRLQVAEDGGFTPHASVSFAVVLALVCLCVLVFYIHHVALYIQADTVIRSVANELNDTIESIYPEALDEYPVELAERTEPGLSTESPPPGVVGATHEGYVQSVDTGKLLDLATCEDLLISLRVRPGTFIIADATIADVWPAERANDDVHASVNEAIGLGERATPEEDPEFAIRQLVEVALRALSPGINDPFTAMACVDRLTSALGKLLRRKFPSPNHYDESQRLRLVTMPARFGDLVDASFDQIRRNSCSTVSVLNRLLGSIALLAPLVERSEDRQALSRHVRTIRDSLDAIDLAQDRDALRAQCARLLEELDDSQSRASAEALGDRSA